MCHSISEMILKFTLLPNSSVVRVRHWLSGGSWVLMYLFDTDILSNLMKRSRLSAGGKSGPSLAL